MTKAGLGSGGAWREWRMVGILTLLSALAFIDKNVIVLMLKPIQADLDLSAVEVTLAIGTAFAVANILVSVPAGWLADRFDRRVVLWSAVVLWSVMAMLCGLAASFLTLVVVRAGVGCAEALLPPSSYSLIRDGVSPTRRSRAFGTFAMATLLGTGSAFLLGGLLVGFATAHDWSGVPVLRQLRPWSIAVGVIGLTGLPISLLAFAFRDPGRAASAVADRGTSARAVMLMLLARRRVFVPLAVFSVAHSMLVNSLNFWSAPILAGRFGMTPAQVGLSMGMLLLVIGPIGLFGIGAAIDWLEKRTANGPGWVAVLTSFILIGAATAFPLASQRTVAWVALGMQVLVVNAFQVVTASTIAKHLPPQTTGRAISIYLVLQGIFGVGIAATLTAWMAEHVFGHSPLPVAAAASVVHGSYASIALLGASALWWVEGRTARARHGERSY